MLNYSVAGLIFTNVKDEALEDLTQPRSVASVPFGGRYRLVDFALSNLVNAKITNVGLIVKENYRSLIDHVGNGVFWDLDRKYGGLHLMPPFNTRVAKRFKSKIEALYGALDFINRSNADYIITHNANIVANIDLRAALKLHNEKDADITVVYANEVLDEGSKDIVLPKVAAGGEIIGFNSKVKNKGAVDRGLGVVIYKREVLCDIVNQAYLDGEYSFEKFCEGYKVFGYHHTGYQAVMNSVKRYFDANMMLLDTTTRKDLFNPDRKVLTKTRDDMPTRYGINAKVSNSLVANGCIIEGTVKNCIVFRGVKVEKNATVENCILMQGTKVLTGANLEYVIADKNATVSEGTVIKGTEKNTFVIKKNQTL